MSQNNIKIINGKTYFQNDNNEWYGIDKNNKEIKVIGKKLLDKLNTEPSKGLGDTIAKITTTLGIEPCESCNKRKEKLNTLFPWMRHDIREVTQDEIELMNKINSNHIIQNADVVSLFKLYNSLFGLKVQKCSCPGLIRRIIGRINDVINTQNDK
jgi:activator of HSP90 ATPase